MTDVSDVAAPTPAPDDEARSAPTSDDPAPGPHTHEAIPASGTATASDAFVPLPDAPAPDAPAPAPDAPGAIDATAPDATAPESTPPVVAQPPAAPAVRVRGLSVRAWGRDVLRAVDLDVPAGQVTALLGPEGAGKTALVRVLLGLDPRRHGEVTVLARDPGRDPLGVRRAVGFVPERPALYDTMTAMTLGRFVAELYPSWQPRRYLDHLARLGVPPRLRVGDLTRSQAARLALAAALGHGPRLLVVDLPHDLDALGRHELLAGVEDDAAATDRTVLVATSHPHEVERIAQHAVVIAAGQVRFAGPVAALRARCRRLDVTAASEPPPLPSGVRALRWRPPTSRRPGELYVLADDPGLDLSTLPGITAAHALTLEEAYLALVAPALAASPQPA